MSRTVERMKGGGWVGGRAEQGWKVRPGSADPPLLPRTLNARLENLRRQAAASASTFLPQTRSRRSWKGACRRPSPLPSERDLAQPALPGGPVRCHPGCGGGLRAGARPRSRSGSWNMLTGLKGGDGCVGILRGGRERRARRGRGARLWGCSVSSCAGLWGRCLG